MGKRLAPATAERGSVCAINETLRAPLPWQMKIHGSNEGEAMHRAKSRDLGTPFASHSRACGPMHKRAAGGLAFLGSPWREFV
jgi:hypothetical protein